MEPIAIVGMSCLFPGAESPIAFWENILSKVDAVTDPPADWQPELFLDPSGATSDRAYTGRGGYLGDLCRFDPVRFRVMPSSVDGGEPDQFIALRCAHEAVEDAERSTVPLNKDRTGVILGRGTFVNRGYVSLHEHSFFVDQTISVLRQLDLGFEESDLKELRRELKRNLPPLGPETVPGLSHSVIVGRIANRLDLHGPAYTLDAACASSLLAVEQAMEELRSGRCDAMIAGGVQVSTPAVIAVMFCHLEALSRTGSISPFGESANGTLLGEGCGMVVLKRLRDAVRDGNRIYALVRAVGVSSDGKGAGILAPRQEGQELSIARAYQLSEIPPASIGLIEAHGTGIPLGDATELASLTASFAPHANGHRIAIGSVKSMISHLIPAAGIASLIKTALALYHRVLPPTLHADEPHPELGISRTPFYLSTETRPWIHGGEAPRRAGVNAFGFGGINTHAILEEHVTRESELVRFQRRWPMELVVVSAEDRDRLRAKTLRLAAWSRSAQGVPLLDLAASAAAESGSSRLAICARDLEDLSEKLELAGKLLAEADRDRIQSRSGVFWYDAPLGREGRLAFVFPGEGAQYVNMLGELALHFPEVRHQFDLTERALSRIESKSPPSRAIFPPPDEVAAAEERVFDAGIAAEAVASANRALLELVRALGVTPDAAVGHSSGEFGALLAAGAIELPSDLEVVSAVERGALANARIAAPGLVPRAVLTTVGGASREAVESVVSETEGLRIAMDNCPHQLVLVGEEEPTARAVSRLQALGALCARLPWDRPYHTPLFSPACEVLDSYYSGFSVRTPDVELWSCATASPYPREPEAIRELAVRQWRSKVRFAETIEAMYRSGVRLFLEVGPRGNLCAFIDDVLSNRPHAAVPLDLPRKPGIDQLSRALAMLVAHGVAFDLEALYRRRQPRLLDWNAPPPAPSPRPPLLKKELPELRIGEELRRSLAMRRRSETVSAPRPSKGTPAPNGLDRPGPPSPRLEALRDYQETMRSFLRTQQQVMTAAASQKPVLAGAVSRAAAAPQWNRSEASSRTPWLNSSLTAFGSSRLVAETDLDSERHTFLKHHTFGRRVSDREPSLAALPVMPLAMTMELMAEAALALRRDFQVVGLRDVRTQRWLGFDEPRRRLRLEAEAIDETSIRVAVHEASRSVAEAIVDLAPRGEALTPVDWNVDAARPSRWSRDDLYGRGMFHGPAFQSLRSLDGVGDGGIRATLVTPDPSLLLPGTNGELSLPVALIDGVGQALGLWLGQNDLAMGFPVGLSSLRLGASMGTGPFEAKIRVAQTGPGIWTSDAEVGSPRGEVVLRIEGRCDRLLPVAPHIWRYRGGPDEIVFGRAILLPSLPAGVAVCGLDLAPRAFLLEDSAFWALVLSRLALSQEERREYDRMDGKPAAVSWLLGRVVMKDAVRILEGLALPMADVEIEADHRGKPAAFFPGARGRRASLVSGAHKALDAVAAAADPDRFAGVGIDLEPIRSLDTGWYEDAFDGNERRLLEEAASLTGESRHAWYLSGWCAKEAIGKALGRGALGGPRNLRIERVEPRSGLLTARAFGSLAREIEEKDPGLAAGSIEARRSIHDGNVVALCLLPRGIA